MAVIGTVIVIPHSHTSRLDSERLDCTTELRSRDSTELIVELRLGERPITLLGVRGRAH